MRLYSYIVSFDGGFAPCVSGPLCTLACCKPRIRATTQYGDWIAGMTAKEYGSGRLIYVMRVERAFTFAEYHSDSKLRARLDNIYRPKAIGGYTQLENDFHGSQSIRKDLSVDRVLASGTFIYFGDTAPAVPKAFSEFVPHGRGHRVFGNAVGEADSSHVSQKIKLLVRWVFSHGKGRKGNSLDRARRHHGCSS
jgi:hypothetical protein